MLVVNHSQIPVGRFNNRALQPEEKKWQPGPSIFCSSEDFSLVGVNYTMQGDKVQFNTKNFKQSFSLTGPAVVNSAVKEPQRGSTISLVESQKERRKIAPLYFFCLPLYCTGKEKLCQLLLLPGLESSLWITALKLSLILLRIFSVCLFNVCHHFGEQPYSVFECIHILLVLFPADKLNYFCHSQSLNTHTYI